MLTDIINNNLTVNGFLNAIGGLNIPANSVGDTQANAGNPFAVNKSRHQYLDYFSQPYATTAVTTRQFIKQGYGSVGGTIVSFSVGLSQVCSGSTPTIVFDLYKNGSSILSGTVSLGTADAILGQKFASLATTTFVAGDVFEVVVTATASGGTLGKGIYAQLVTNENNT